MVVPPQGTRPQIWEVYSVCCHVTAVSTRCGRLLVALRERRRRGAAVWPARRRKPAALAGPSLDLATYKRASATWDLWCRHRGCRAWGSPHSGGSPWRATTTAITTSVSLPSCHPSRLRLVPNACPSFRPHTLASPSLTALSHTISAALARARRRLARRIAKYPIWRAARTKVSAARIATTKSLLAATLQSRSPERQKSILHRAPPTL
ncbi:hypothetical protein PsYK624_171300 [Phanerochaete sordida]|uniref:Uncharacterized protein n=1 Tax=Phanerochaete sordida TaxID=48140 RepID=A0A9P3LPR4_9APHY|nr:hypothetical protein PsYK624_171300 [Phanerochaete sordida]